MNLLAELTYSLDRKCLNRDFMLMCILEDDYAQSMVQEIRDNRLVIKRIRKFAHWTSTDKFDEEGWKEVYKNIRIKAT